MRTTLEKTDFTNARLSYVNFNNANMRNTVLVNIVFNIEEMRGADITGADFTNVTILNSNLADLGFDSVIGLDKIICAPHTTRDCKVLQGCSNPNNPYC